MYSSNKTSSLALFFFLNLLFFSLVTSHQVVQPPTPSPPVNKCATPPVNNGATPPVNNGATPPVNNGATCPRNTLNIQACANVLNIASLLLNQQQSYPPCCSLIQGLVDLEARLCICIALKVKVGGIATLTVPINLDLIFNSCGRQLGSPYNRCPA